MDRFSTAVLFAEGATSQVFRARDPETGREVALKLLRGDDPELLRRFRFEAETLERLSHPSIAKLIDYGETGGRPYLAVEFIDGAPIDKALAGESPEVIAKVFLKVVDAVAHAHDQGLLHRDLKPANVLVRRDGDREPEPFVVDFGLARDVAAPGQTATGALLGTPSFMAPEQARGDRDAVGCPADIYGLGAVLFAVLTGRAPHEADSAGDVIAAVLSGPPERPGRDIPIRLEAILNRAMARRPEHRYPTARRMAADLEGWLDGRTVSAMRGFRWRLARQAMARRKWLTAGVAAGLIAVLALAVQQAWLVQRASEQRELAIQLSEELADTRERMRLRYLAPAHDIRSGWSFFERRIDAMRDKATSGETRNLPTVHYALGRLLLDAGRPDEALPSLQRARTLGCESIDCASALARAHLLLHRNELERWLESVSDRTEPPRHHLASAREALSDVEVAGPAALLVAAATVPVERVAVMGETATSHSPWAYEVPQAVGEARYRAGLDATRADELGAAFDYFRAAIGDFARAAEIARSYPEAYTGVCRSLLRMMEIAGKSGERALDVPDDAERLCAQARRIDSFSVEAYTLPALLEELAAGSAYLAGDFSESSRRIQVALEILDEAPEAAGETAEFALAEAHVLMNSVASQQLIDRPAVERVQAALAAAQRAIDLAPESILAQRTWISAFRTLSGYSPESATRHAERAAEYARTVAQRWPEERSGRRALGGTLVDLAYHRRLTGNIDEPLLRQGISILEALVADAPDYRAARTTFGIALWELAVTKQQRGEDFRQVEARARRQFETLLARQPDRPTALINLSGVNLSIADGLIERGEDPGDRLTQSMALLERVQALGEYLPCDFALVHWLESQVASDPEDRLRHEMLAAKHARSGSSTDCRRVANELELKLATGQTP